MEKEFLKNTARSVTLNVTAGKIDSFRETEETTGTVRVYDNGCIGVAGCLGQIDEDALTARAEEALALGIPYPCALEGTLVREELHEEPILPVQEMLPTMQAFLDRLSEACPRFAFSNKITQSYRKTEYRNSLGRKLVSSGWNLDMELIVQNRGSGNLFDSCLAYSGDHFCPEALLEQFREQYEAFYRPAELESGRYCVLIGAEQLFDQFFQQFEGSSYASGASLFSGKLGQKVFSDRLTLHDDRNPVTAPGACFFDAEGCVAPNFRPVLIKNGVLTGVLTTKKTAQRFQLPNLGTAGAVYDGVPASDCHRLSPAPTAADTRELAPGKAVYVVLAGGGDTTPDGHFATPVQMAYLMENGRLVGRLPELNIGGNFFDLLGRDYLGTVRGQPQEDSLLCAITMDVRRD